MGSNRYVGTQTEKNLLEAFSGESQARNKYTYFASVAKKEAALLSGKNRKHRKADCIRYP